MTREGPVAQPSQDPSGERARDLLASVEAKGARLWLDRGELRYRAPARSLSEEELQQLRRCKAQIVQILAGREGGRADRATTGAMEAPLAFSQLQHWNFYDLGRHPAMRHLAAVRRIRGRLDEQMLERSVQEIIRRQDSLRTRFVQRDGVPVQVIAASSDWALTVRDLRCVPAEDIEARIQSEIERIVTEKVDVSRDPLFALELLRVAAEDHVLVLAMEHIISDMWSVGLFLRDLFDVYEQLIAGQPVTLARPPVQFFEFASWQRSQEAACVQQHGAFWEERLHGFGRDRFPRQQAAPAEAVGWDLVPIELAPELSRALSSWCRVQRTTLVMGVFALYAALIQRWLGRDETIIRFESNGRVSRNLERTIGYFTVPLFLRCRLGRQDTFAGYLQRSLHEYCVALERSDFSYLEARLPRPGYSRNTSFNWIPHTPGSRVRGDLAAQGWSVSEYAFENPFLRTLERDTEPFVLFGQDAIHTMSRRSADANEAKTCCPEQAEGRASLSATRSATATRSCDVVVGAIYYPRNQFSREEIERLAHGFIAMAEAVTTNAGARVFDVPLNRPSG